MLFLGSAQAQEFHRSWSKSLRFLAPLRADWNEESRPAYFNGVLYVASLRGEVAAVKAETGEIIWQKRLKGAIPYGLAADANGVYFGLDDGTFRCLAAADGAEKWNLAIRSAVVSQPTIAEGVVYFMAGDDSLYAVETVTGQWKWQYNRGLKKQISILGLPAPLVIKGTVIIGLTDGLVVALNAKSGELQWGTHVGEITRFEDLDATPVISDNSIFVAKYEGGVFAVSLQGGDIIWKNEGNSIYPLASRENLVIYADLDGVIHALNRSDGKEAWKASCKHGGIPTGPVIVGKSVILSDSLGHIHILDLATGKELKRLHIWGGFHTTPIIVENQIYLINGRGKVFSFKIE